MADRSAHAHEKARQQHIILVIEYRTRGDRAGRGVELRREIVEMPLVRIAFLILETDLDRDARNVSQVRSAKRPSRLGDASPDSQDLRLAQRKIDVDRVVLDDGRE